MRNSSAELLNPLVPRRRRGVEYLDEPGVDPRTVIRSLGDVTRANALFGGTGAVLAELNEAYQEIRASRVTLLDLGTGLGDIPRRAREAAHRLGIHLTTIGVDSSHALARACCSRELPMVRADARVLPFAANSVDIVMCSQLLHHFTRPDALIFLREMDRVARYRVIVSDLRRSWIAVGGIWLVSFPLGFLAESRHDGVVSVLRGFRLSELRELLREAVGIDPTARVRIGFRLTATWRPA